MSLICRHNRFRADCPICSKGTVLEPGRGKPARRSTRTPAKPAGAEAASRMFSGPHVSAGPYADDDGSYEVRLERVPGGIRLAEWGATGLRRRAPVLPAADLRGLVERAPAVLEDRDAARLADALPEVARGGAAAEPGATLGVSRGRSGDFKDELRIETVDGGRVRIARWVLRPGSGWELRDAPPMLPAARYAEALEGVARHGVRADASDAGGGARL